VFLLFFLNVGLLLFLELFLLFDRLLKIELGLRVLQLSVVFWLEKSLLDIQLLVDGIDFSIIILNLFNYGLFLIFQLQHYLVEFVFRLVNIIFKQENVPFFLFDIDSLMFRHHIILRGFHHINSNIFISFFYFLFGLLIQGVLGTCFLQNF